MKFIILAVLTIILGGCSTPDTIHDEVIKAADKICSDVNSSVKKIVFNVHTTRRETQIRYSGYIHCKNDFEKPFEIKVVP